MRKLIVALAGASVLAACDPTEKHDYSCYAKQLSLNGCVQLHITEIEGNAASIFCERSLSEEPPGLGGDWDYSSCDLEHETFGTRTAGHCAIADFWEGYDAKVFFYEMSEDNARIACEAEYTWVPGSGT